MRFRAAAAWTIGVLLTSSCADAGLASSDTYLPVPSSGETLHPGENPVPASMPEAATMLTQLLEENTNFGHVAAGDAGSLALSWHGDPPADALETVALAYPDVAVTVVPIDVVPGDLAEIITFLVTTKAHLGVGAASVENDYSTIVVQVDEQVQDHDAFAKTLSAEIGFPVKVEGGAPVSAIG